jgi:hypothetical protein
MSHKVKGVPASQVPASELEHRVRVEMECKLLQAVHAVDLVYLRQTWSTHRRPSLSKIAVVYMSVHATACAPERNWSRCGNLYGKKRNALDVQRVKIIISLQDNDAESIVVAEDEELLFSYALEASCHISPHAYGVAIVLFNELCALKTMYCDRKRRQRA